MSFESQELRDYTDRELERLCMTEQIRTAVVIIPDITRATDRLREVQAYLPSNYTARLEEGRGAALIVLIEGIDNAGWTLDGYVIPRLASGLISAKERMTMIDTLTLVIDITDQDIAEGIKGNCTKCPAALAMIRALKELGYEIDDSMVTAGIDNLWIDDRPPVATTGWAERMSMFRVRTPDVLRDFIQAYDHSEPVRPMRVEVTLTRNR